MRVFVVVAPLIPVVVVVKNAIRVMQVKTPVLMGADVTHIVKNVCHHVIAMVNGLRPVLISEIVAATTPVVLNVV